VSHPCTHCKELLNFLQVQNRKKIHAMLTCDGVFWA
jgi:cytidine deaminase